MEIRVDEIKSDSKKLFSRTKFHLIRSSEVGMKPIELWTTFALMSSEKSAGAPKLSTSLALNKQHRRIVETKPIVQQY